MGTQIERYPCAVLGAGKILDYSRVASFIAPGAFVVCADGGLVHCGALSLSPGLLIGDFDSLDGTAHSDISRILLSPDKNYTDSFYAVNHALVRGYTRMLLTGMLGGRLDHTLANFQLLARLAGEGVSALLTDGVTDAYALSGEGELLLPCREGCYFSLFALENCQGVTITGGKYPLDEYPLRVDDPRAVSNEFAGEDVLITQGSGLLIALSCPIDNAE